MKSKLFIFFTLAVFVYIVFNRFSWTDNQVFHWDKEGYYSYLPALFIYNDIDSLNFYPEVNEKYKTVASDIPFYAVYDQPQTSKRLNKYAIGVAVAELPFFAAAHIVTIITGKYPADGFSSYYQLFVLLASVAWTIFGFFCLRSLLKRYFDDTTVLISILLLAFGTNLYHYTIFEGGMSHCFSFAFFAAALNSADLFYRTQHRRHFWLCALWLGMITITRPTNLIFFIALFLWDINSWNDIKQRFQLFFSKKVRLLLAVLVFFSVLFIQVSYWKYITGHWIHYSYEEEGFNFFHPEIWKGLFSYRKGWFVYTPLALTASFGFIILWNKYRQFFWPCLFFLLLHVYIVFSWYQWYYGGGFGARPMVEALVALAMPLACLVDWIRSRIHFALKATFAIVLSAIVSLNIWQTYQYSFGTLPWDHNNKEYYWKVFFKKHASDEDWKLLRF